MGLHSSDWSRQKTLLRTLQETLKELYSWLTATYRGHYGPTQPLFDFDVLSVQRQTLKTVTRNSYGLSSFCRCSRNSHAKHWEHALATYTQLYLFGYVTLTTHSLPYTKTELTIFTNTLTDRTRTCIQFTKEIEENGKIPFLDCLITRDTTNYKRLFTEKRAQLVCHSLDSLQDVTDYLKNLFSKNNYNYNTDFVRRKTHSNTDSNTQTNVNTGPVTKATIPYIRGTSSETKARILQPYNRRVAHKPITSLPRLLTNVKDKDRPEDRQGAVYKIKCCELPGYLHWWNRQKP